MEKPASAYVRRTGRAAAPDEAEAPVDRPLIVEGVAGDHAARAAVDLQTLFFSIVFHITRHIEIGRSDSHVVLPLLELEPGYGRRRDHEVVLHAEERPARDEGKHEYRDERKRFKILMDFLPQYIYVRLLRHASSARSHVRKAMARGERKVPIFQ